VTNTGTRQARTMITNEVGRYYAPALNPGSYEVLASLPGFQNVLRQGITLTVGSEVIIDFKLTPGQVSETVDVTGEAPIVQTTNANVAELVNDVKIRALPLNGRSFDQLIYLQPGITVATAAGNSPNQGRGVKFSANGARLTSNYFMLDGTDINDAQNFTPGGAGGQLFGVESIQEFQVITHNQSAQYGRSMGGIINAITRSGTNTLHGSGYEFLRNSALDAKNFFDDPNSPIPAFKRNQFGGTLGGPIRKDKIFFFANYEGLRERLGVSKNALVPDRAARNGDIPGLTHININPAVTPYLNLIPLPNGPSTGPGIAQYRFSQQQPTDVDYVTGRVDVVASSKDSLFTRYTIDDSTKLRMDAPDHVLGLFAENEKHRNQYVTLGWTRTISPSVLNIGRLGFNRSVSLVDLSKLGDVPDSLAFIQGQPFGRMTIGGISPCCATINDPRYFRMNSFQPSDDLSINVGKHAFKTGFVVERFQWNTANYNRIGGDYVFANLSDFLRGTVQSVQAPFPGSDPIRGIRATLFGTYFQDDYRVNSRLTLNLGLRYELTTVPTEVNGRMSFLDNPLDTTLENKKPYDPNHLNFAPRFGFAWDVSGNGKTAVRGGFGMFYDQIVMNQFLNLFDRNPPEWRTVRLGANAPFPHPLDGQFSTVLSPQVIVRDNFKTPYMYQYNLTIQREVMQNLSVSLGYVGSLGKHLIQRYDGNTPLPQVRADGSLFIPAGAPRRNPIWGAISTRNLAGFSNYNALQLSVVRRFAQGFQLQGSYTYAKSIDTSSGLFSEEATNAATGALNADRIFQDKALSNFDVRNAANINFNYDLPFGKNLTGTGRQILGGWEVGSIVTLSQGVPFTVENSDNRSRNLASGADFADRPNLVAGMSNNPTSGVTKGCSFGTTSVPPGARLGTPELWFDPCAFVPQELGTFGNLGRNTLIGPGLSTVDFVINKHFQVKEDKELQFRSEFFNVMNHPNFLPPSATTRRIFDNNGRLVGAPGAITQTATPSRQIQFGLKFIF
jgi:Carboxypeptidase regulatory-like domain